MSTTFPRSRKSKLGYNVDQVEDFLEEARRAYTADRGDSSVVSSRTIRKLAFAMQKGGYSPVHVDSALERLEDAFASRERDRAIAELGETAWYANARSEAQEILNRLARRDGKKFARTSSFTIGYSIKDVDAFAQELSDYFQHGAPLTIDRVRTAAFRSAKGGYREAQVDYLIDSVIDVMLAVR
ncbi:DivIVA domain-containing protein [Salinibacterium sp. NSLL150]|uniref:DivIVA domain-containing protein n=1 Tax=unclassified Salinibacterium TaxID=2632331 RepID=UPI0018CD0D2B|nr:MULTISPECIES: DivIVA domain-containing protein [unclassified Salinibacterium]MBH0098701.1 DivIVA domain-containing protein [Salinibacterium sp. NSLL35]MBH0101456.1 DivIVA domain-containing protein [Salinibacterium sp. NSLL150]MBH0104215.1 DivIVA domain-containing protein [Salinibacterium sp. NSLL16]MBH0106976.1 DivIVA domain-containing protein [Salinibacterium sp. NSLL17]